MKTETAYTRPCIAWNSVYAEEQFAGLVMWYEQKNPLDFLASQMKKAQVAIESVGDSSVLSSLY